MTLETNHKSTAWHPLAEAERIVAGIGQRPVASMAYATAAAARLHRDGGPLFPAARHWLRTHQHSDGSWGGRIPHAHDRTVATLAAVAALDGLERDWAVAARRRGARYLCAHGGRWRGSATETVGFELIAAYLSERLRSSGLAMAGLYELRELRAAKLAHFPGTATSAGPTTVLYSLEAAEGVIDTDLAVSHLSPDGAMADNPAATAAVWEATGNAGTLGYLCRAADSTGDGGMPEVYPIDVFEPAWVLYHLHRAGLRPPSAARQVALLRRRAAAMKPDRPGLGISRDFPVPDSDDTAMVANVLCAYGFDDNGLLEALLSFERPAHFVGYPYERGTPVSANGRVLEALTRRGDRFQPQITKVTTFLFDTRRERAWWNDKWHLSPYYATAQAVFGLAATVPRELSRTWRWLVDSQHADGSWGMAGGQPEETAYAVLALDVLEICHGPAARESYQRAHRYLADHLPGNDFAELWIGKGLYTPPGVVRAAILAAHTISGRHSLRYRGRAGS
ncbi:prenyltransferase/squalene oxidase repeat-containing protein [Nocardia goodfellowii]|uniref:Halimadienyl-diphosphate synthase n=1 Tax=Nocardia goodfellowii TaxID=882446 RepID=A0ABS4QIM2_9NOCA|nr:prenyltransferase/squalene oxidase repeat-containing protein [Nocardia goodfellowii]MBP2191567.1 halimadienyl-diphosphate synthase [Nocardia goodfellowii]